MGGEGRGVGGGGGGGKKGTRHKLLHGEGKCKRLVMKLGFYESS